MERRRPRRRLSRRREAANHRGAGSGATFGAFLVMLGAERFLVEFVRAKDDRFLGPFTIAQLISVLLIAAGGAIRARRRQR